MRLPAPFLIVLTALCPAFASAQATLNKCIDAQGQVTYTNKPCLNAHEVRKLEIDPPPVPDQPRTGAVHAQSDAKPAVAKPLPDPAPATIQLETRRTNGKTPQRSPAGQCDALSDKLGRVLDNMDQARRKGYTQEQMDKWNEETRELERKKQQAGCF